MKEIQKIGLVAHDNMKKDLIEWVEWNFEILLDHEIICTGTTGKFVEDALLQKISHDKDIALKIKKLKSGPLGGDQQLGALVAEAKIDMLIFFWDPMQAQPHDVDVKALLRIATVYNIPTAINRSSANFLISSKLMKKGHTPVIKDFSGYISRNVDL